jgi:medium-chain acyl-[acyl-carrier-protein] hydrolase
MFNIAPDASDKYEKVFYLHSYNIDKDRTLSITSLIEFLLETAGFHTEVCGVGWKVLKDHNVFWVLSNLFIKFNEFPVWNQEIKIETWSTGLKGVFAQRCFIVYNSTGKILMKATSDWLMVNTLSRRIVRADRFMGEFPHRSEKLFEFKVPQILIPENLKTVTNLKVQYSEIDMNGHMNSAKYPERIINAIGLKYLNKTNLDYINLSYIKESVYDEQIISNIKFVDNKTCIGQLVDNNNVEKFTMCLKWN